MGVKQSLVPLERIERAILLIRGEKVILDAEIAVLYEVETKVLSEAIKRHIERFPPDFMFHLTKAEFDHLRSQSVTSSQWGGRRYPPYAFTEQGVAMLSSVLNSPGRSRSTSRSCALLSGCAGCLPLMQTWIENSYPWRKSTMPSSK
jgi:hypothetical protein